MISGSKMELLYLIKRKGRISIEESAVETKLAKSTLREHFTQLESDGYVERSYKRSGPGRPALFFELTRKGNKIFPSYEPELLREFVGYLKKQGNIELLEEFFTQFWSKRQEEAKSLCESAKAKSVKQKLPILAVMLQNEGFMPEYTNSELKECNCPFAEVVKETRLPCKLEKEFISHVLNTEVKRTKYIPDGDYSCNYHLI